VEKFNKGVLLRVYVLFSKSVQQTFSFFFWLLKIQFITKEN